MSFTASIACTRLCLRNAQLMDAAWTSLRLAFYTACASVVLGTMSALMPVRMRRFHGKTVFAGMITAPLVMPAVTTGLWLLLLFVSFGALFGVAFPRDMTTLWKSESVRVGKEYVSTC